MILTKKSMLKDGSFLPILLQSETMFLFPGYFLGRRRNLKFFFVHFERTLNGVFFDKTFSAGNDFVFAGERFKCSQNSIFSICVPGTWFEGLVPSHETSNCGT